MSKINGNAQKQLRACDCGCSRESHWHRLHAFQAEDGKRYHILDECRKAFAEEVKAHVIIKDLVAKLRHQPFWRRWAFARSWFACQHIRHARLKGVDVAARHARRDTMLFVLPVCMAAFVSKLTGRKEGL